MRARYWSGSPEHRILTHAPVEVPNLALQSTISGEEVLI
jgi:hypothetical protein